jgi:SAM-dependent methyltransferase
VWSIRHSEMVTQYTSISERVARAVTPREGSLPASGSFEDRWRARFKEFAERREDDAGIAGWSETGLAARMHRFRQLWQRPLSSELWLDAGCGAGTYTRYMHSQGARVVGLDYSGVTIEKARARGVRDMVWAVGDVTRLPLTRGTFDGAVCFGVTQALSSSERVLRELSRVVRPGGQIWVDALNGWCVPHVWERIRRKLGRRPVHVRYESPRSMLRMLRHNGLTEVRLHWIPILPARFVRLQPAIESTLARLLFRFVPLLGALFSHAFAVQGRRPGR